MVNDQADKWAKAKVCVYADSVLCVGRMEQGPGAADRRWEGQVEDLRVYSSYQDAVGIDGEEVELSGANFPGFFDIVYSSRNPGRLGGEEHPTRELR